ncbi:MAG: DUF2254 domain-containing protein [Methanomicrobia archaeon]|nr:DUF2254 domain-containing protein [Methanomicrobia archaeon]
MQDAKVALKNLVTQAKETYHKWEIRHLWPARILEYFLLSLLVSLVGAIFFKYFNLFQTNVDSARYMLSALVQTQAAIVAIVVTLTLIAVQLTAQAYSPRVIRIFRDNPDMWILLLFYVVSILYGLLVLKMIQTGNLRQITLFGSYLEYHLFSAYIAVAFTFFMLFPYMWNIINLLNPATIINRLAAEITKDSLLKSEEDPIQPIMDIVHGSIMKYDIATTRDGLRAVTDRVIELIDSDNDEKISKLFCDHLKRVCRLAIRRDDEESAIEVIKNLEIFGKSTAEKKLSEATRLAVTSLGMIGEAAAEKGFEVAAIQAAISLEKVGVASAEKILKDATKISVEFLFLIGCITVEKDFEDATGHVVVSLGTIGIRVAKNDLEDAVKRAAVSLLTIGIQATKKKFEVVRGEVADYLAQLTILRENVVKTVIRNIQSILTEEQRDPFSKIMDLYKPELQKLRAEQQQ